MQDSENHVRVHIGNISAKLAENPDLLTKRLSKFGDIITGLEFRTKPVNDHYYGFVTLSITEKNFNHLKSSLNNVMFMGMKLSIARALPDFQTQWKADADRIGKSQVSKDRIQAERQRRIREYETNHHINTTTGEIVPMQISKGYNKSPHVFQDKSGETKNAAPKTTLVGSKSYGSLTFTLKFYDQAYSMTSGGSEIVRGRIRKTPRSNHALRHQTLRILVNDNLKQFKFFKKKLWGVEKNAVADDLTYQYQDGVWKSGNNHIVERVLPNYLRCGINGQQAMQYGKGTTEDNEYGHSVDEGSNFHSNPEYKDESKSSLAVLSSMFANYDFDKPVELDEDNDEEFIVDDKGKKRPIRFDYETQGNVFADPDDTSFGKPVDPSLIEAYKQQINMPQEEVYYDEDDEGNEMDFDQQDSAINDKDEIHQENTEEQEDEAQEDEAQEDEAQEDEAQEDEAQEDESQEDEAQEDESQEDETQEETHIQEQDHADNITNKADQADEHSSSEEFVPNFGSKEPALKSNTETLRSLFNPESTSFKLALDNDDDIDETKDQEVKQQQYILKQIKSKQHQEQREQQLNESGIIKPTKDIGLFWFHNDSPFLQTQAQLSRLGGVNDPIKLPGEDEEEFTRLRESADNEDETPYEKWFWSMRGEVTRECKRRRRDVVRILRKKSHKVTV